LHGGRAIGGPRYGDVVMEVIAPHSASVGALTVGRVLPRRQRRKIGHWCFVDVMGPSVVNDQTGLDVGPHPHIGLQTVTWLIHGAVLHRDSLGSEQLIRPGQLNLMTAGHGVSHSEETRGIFNGPIHGVQFWVAQPEATRHGPAEFAHHVNLPRLDIAGASGSTATVVLGEFGGERSPARCDTEHVLIELVCGAGRTALPLTTTWEHGILALDETVNVSSTSITASITALITGGHLGYLPPGTSEVIIDAAKPARVMLLGGEVCEETITMWWNYVARTRSEIASAHQEWTQRSPRFGSVASQLAAIDVAPPP
jgi:quercetin 2,3-dioxygenase